MKIVANTVKKRINLFVVILFFVMGSIDVGAVNTKFITDSQKNQKKLVLNKYPFKEYPFEGYHGGGNSGILKSSSYNIINGSGSVYHNSQDVASVLNYNAVNLINESGRNGITTKTYNFVETASKTAVKNPINKDDLVNKDGDASKKNSSKQNSKNSDSVPLDDKNSNSSKNAKKTRASEDDANKKATTQNKKKDEKNNETTGSDISAAKVELKTRDDTKNSTNRKDNITNGDKLKNTKSEKNGNEETGNKETDFNGKKRKENNEKLNADTARKTAPKEKKLAVQNKDEEIRNKEIVEIKEVPSAIVIDGVEHDLPLSLKKVIDLALQRNRDLEVARISVEIAKNSMYKQLSGFLPTARLEGIANLSEADRFLADQHNNPYISKGTWGSNLNGAVRVDYNITNFGRGYAGYKAAKHALHETEYEKEQRILDVVQGVAEQYFNVLSQQARCKAREEMRATYQEALNAAELKYNIGIVPLVDKLTAGNSYMKAEIEKVESENNLTKAKASLNLLLNLEPLNDLVLDDSKTDKIKKISPDLDELIQWASENVITLKELEERRKRIATELYATTAAFLPSVDISASVGASKQIYPKINDSNLDKFLYNTNVNLTVSMPLFSGFYNTSNVRIKKRELKTLDVQIEQFRKRVVNEVMSAYYDFESNQKKYFLAKEALETASENAKVSLGMYKNGRASILDVMNANSTLEEAKFNFIDAKYSWLIYRIRLMKAAGKMNMNNLNNLAEVGKF